MNLKMTGIDFTRAGIDIRQRFSFTRNAGKMTRKSPLGLKTYIGGCCYVMGKEVCCRLKGRRGKEQELVFLSLRFISPS